MAGTPYPPKPRPQALLFHCCPRGGERARVRLRVAFASAFTEPRESGALRAPESPGGVHAQEAGRDAALGWASLSRVLGAAQG